MKEHSPTCILPSQEGGEKHEEPDVRPSRQLWSHLDREALDLLQHLLAISIQ
jgi:hypothetical protein